MRTEIQPIQDHRLLLEGFLKRSTKVGQLFVPAGSLESHLGRFTTNLVVWTHDETHKLSLLGSTTPVYFRGRYLLLCSRHQLDGVDHEDVSVLFPDGSRVVTSSGSRTFKITHQPADSDAYDVAAFDFSDPIKEFPTLKRQFFDFSSTPPDTTNDKIVAFILAGFPSTEQSYELEDKNHLGILKRILVALPDSQPSDEALLRIKYVKKLAFGPDGMSGGPVFVVQIVDNEFAVYLAGMLLRSGSEAAHFLKSEFLRAFLTSFVEDG